MNKTRYLNNYENRIRILIKRLQDGTLPASKGELIGTMREISEYDSLASTKTLYDAASDVDLFYSRNVKIDSKTNSDNEIKTFDEWKKLLETSDGIKRYFIINRTKR